MNMQNETRLFHVRANASAILLGTANPRWGITNKGMHAAAAL